MNSSIAKTIGFGPGARLAQHVLQNLFCGKFLPEIFSDAHWGIQRNIKYQFFCTKEHQPVCTLDIA